MTGELQYEPRIIKCDTAYIKSHIELMNTFNPLVTDPAVEAKDDYKKIADGWEADVEIFAARIKRSSESAWSGPAATAARQAIADYATDALNFTPALQALSARVDETISAVHTTKEKLPPYADAQSWWNPFDWFDGDPEKEAEEQAQRVVEEHYFDPVFSAGGQIPVLPTPKDPVTAADVPSGGGDDNGGGGANDRGTTDTQPTTTEDTTTTEDPSTTDEPSTEDPSTEDDTTTDDSATEDSQPSTTEDDDTTAQTTPQTTTPQSGVPSSTQPGSGIPTGSGGGGGGAGGSTGPSPGQSVVGTPVGARAATGAGLSTGAASGGRAGMPGMGGMGAGGARGKGDEDDEHTTPDYLVYDRESELLGAQPPALPPGGVIGG
ncbi:hypothetical protein [Nocardia rhizosphaerae]|uniref:Type VII secretion system (Wss) protein ESAT-6 n=1 Tax=Nocardia rhizosphaerae TaxID=1691571 RepID=A0ABV8KZC2_9NOCA